MTESKRWDLEKQVNEILNEVQKLKTTDLEDIMDSIEVIHSDIESLLSDIEDLETQEED